MAVFFLLLYLLLHPVNIISVLPQDDAHLLLLFLL